MSTIIIGIDPGLTGAVAVWTYWNNGISVRDLPVSARTTGKGNQLDAASLAAMLRPVGVPATLHAYVEAQRPMSKQGVTSMLSLGRTIGVIEGVLATLGIPTTLVEPQVWKRSLGLLKTDKDMSRTRALQLFPDLAMELARKKDHGRAEAALIAYYGSQKVGAFSSGEL